MTAAEALVYIVYCDLASVEPVHTSAPSPGTMAAQVSRHVQSLLRVSINPCSGYHDGSSSGSLAGAEQLSRCQTAECSEDVGMRTGD